MYLTTTPSFSSHKPTSVLMDANPVVSRPVKEVIELPSRQAPSLTANGIQVLQTVKLFDINNGPKVVVAETVTYAQMDRQLKDVKEPAETNKSYDYFGLAKRVFTTVVRESVSGFMDAVKWTDPVSYNFILTSFAFSTSLVAVAAQSCDPNLQSHPNCVLDTFYIESAVTSSLNMFDLATMEGNCVAALNSLQAINSTIADRVRTEVTDCMNFTNSTLSQSLLVNQTVAVMGTDFLWKNQTGCVIDQSTINPYCFNLNFCAPYTPSGLALFNQTCDFSTTGPGTTGPGTTGPGTTGTTGPTTDNPTGTTGFNPTSGDQPSSNGDGGGFPLAGIIGLAVGVPVVAAGVTYFIVAKVKNYWPFNNATVRPGTNKIFEGTHDIEKDQRATEMKEKS